MPQSTSLLMLEFLTWVSSRRRTYPETMEAWRSSCPRHTVWEDALAEGLVQLQGAPRLDETEVTLTARGRAVLEETGRDPRNRIHEKGASCKTS